MTRGELLAQFVTAMIAAGAEERINGAYPDEEGRTRDILQDDMRGVYVSKAREWVTWVAEEVAEFGEHVK